jgi:excinuclease ABC subunit A
VNSLDLKPLNELPDIPVYGSDPRVSCKNLQGPWQEIQLRTHALAEIDKPAFWEFVEKAVHGFQRLTEKAQTNPDDLMPWRVLGRKWHLSRKGFPPGKRVHWEPEVLEDLCETLSDIAPDAQFLWNSQMVVHVCLNGPGKPWATLHTKHPSAVELVLNGPKNRFSLGRVAALASEREVDGRATDRDQVKLRFRTREDLAAGDLPGFLQEHLAAAEHQPEAQARES